MRIYYYLNKEVKYNSSNDKASDNIQSYCSKLSTNNFIGLILCMAYILGNKFGMRPSQQLSNLAKNLIQSPSLKYASAVNTHNNCSNWMISSR